MLLPCRKEKEDLSHALLNLYLSPKQITCREGKLDIYIAPSLLLFLLFSIFTLVLCVFVVFVLSCLARRDFPPSFCVFEVARRHHNFILRRAFNRFANGNPSTLFSTQVLTQISFTSFQLLNAFFVFRMMSIPLPIAYTFSIKNVPLDFYTFLKSAAAIKRFK